MMKAREFILVGIAGVSLCGYWLQAREKKTIGSASEQFGRAMLKGDTKSLWTYVTEDERRFYGFNEDKFAKFWNQLVAPTLKEFDSFKMESRDSNGIHVILSSHHPAMKNAHFNMLVSGQFGEYNSPFIVAYSTVGVAAIPARDCGSRTYLRFQAYEDWFRQNRSTLEGLGITKIRRGPACLEGETLDEMIAYFHKAVQMKKAQVSVAFR